MFSLLPAAWALQVRAQGRNPFGATHISPLGGGAVRAQEHNTSTVYEHYIMIIHSDYVRSMLSIMCFQIEYFLTQLRR